MTRLLAIVAVAVLAGCAPPRPSMTAAEGRAMVASYMPASIADKDEWTDLRRAG